MKYNLMFLDQILFFFLVIGLKFLNFLIFNELHLNIFHMHNLDIKKNENFTLTYKVIWEIFLDLEKQEQVIKHYF